jgi:predicted amidophosphoribosyltransferase
MGRVEAAIRRRVESECRLCHAVVSDPEWRALCELAGAPAYHDPGRRICAKCVRQQQEANRQAAEAWAREDEKRRNRPPPIGLRVVN